VDALSTGFIYVVSDASITGMKSGISSKQIAYFERIKALQLKTPQFIGFGISDKNSFQTVCQYAHGAIIGSAFIKYISDKPNVAKATKEFVDFVLQ
jgi:tryptophan synthase alpha chain